MDNQEIAIYLSNIIKIIRANGTISSNEESVFEEICKELKAKKKDISESERVASEEANSLILTSRFSDNIRNLEDMIAISLSDGNIDVAEKDLILNFAKQIKLTQEQINTIVKQSKKRLEKTTTDARCNHCNSSIPSGSKFCMACGSAINESGMVKQTDFNYPTQGISIEFAESTSATFDMAYKVASSASDFQQCERSKKMWYLATWSISNINKAIELADNLKGVRNRKVYVNAKLMDWNDVFGFARCFEDREKAYSPEKYCFGIDDNEVNLWGCREIRMGWNDWAEWLSYGRFESKNVFIFDKLRIKHELETALSNVQYCPYVRPRWISAVLNSLPDKVTIDMKKNWKYRESYSETPNSIKVKIQEKEDGHTFSNEFYTTGVRPIGLNIARDIFNNAIRKSGIQDLNANILG